MFWKDNLPVLGNQPPYIDTSFCLGHLQVSSDFLLVSSLLLPEVSAQVSAVMYGLVAAQGLLGQFYGQSE